MKRAEKEKDKSQKRDYVAKATICKQIQASASKSKQVQANQADNDNENESTNVDNKERYTDVYPKKGELSLPWLANKRTFPQPITRTSRFFSIIFSQMRPARPLPSMNV